MRAPFPAYRLHKSSGQAVVTIPTPTGRVDRYLGPYNSPESRTEYVRLCAELAAAVSPAAVARSPVSLVTVAEVLLAFWTHVQTHYRHPDGTPTTEVYNFKLSLRTVRELYSHVPANKFGPLALRAVRERMIAQGWCRKQVNGRVGRIKRMFKWAASVELVPAAVYQSLTTVEGLQAGRSGAVEREPVKPVAAATVAATLPFLTRHVAGLVRFQLLTGCRPGEACGVKMADINASEPVWVYRPGKHKTKWRGKARSIPIGPRCQELLRAFAPADPDDFVFSPRRSVAEFRAARTAARKTKSWPSHLARNAANRVETPKRSATASYQVTALEKAVTKAVERANRRRERLAGPGNFDPVPHRHPNQLRHAVGTKVRKDHGLEAAQVLLGHARADVTQTYAERNESLAAAVAKEMG